MAEWVGAAAMLASAGVSAYSVSESQRLQEEAMDKQEEAQKKAEAKQTEADYMAEKRRLEALAANQTATDYGSVWGVDSNKFVDAAQKLSAGTGSFDTDDDETNPFYYRGLL